MFITFSYTLHVFKTLYMELAISATVDITIDGFGFSWLPCIYSMQASYLAVYPVHLGNAGLPGSFTVQGFAYCSFRRAKNDMNRFQIKSKAYKVGHLKYVEKKSGSKLLASGWWGIARHINYLGNWIMV